MTPRVAIPIGHSPTAPGVSSAEPTEHDFNAELAAQLWPMLHEFKINAKVFRRPEPSYTRGMVRMIAEINAWHPDLVISLHSNGSEAPMATGAECLHWPVRADQLDRDGIAPKESPYLEDCAKRISEAVAKCLGIRNRGSVVQTHSWNNEPFEKFSRLDGKRIPNGKPLYILRDCDAVINESHFMSTPSDHAKAMKALEDGSLSRAMAVALDACVEDFR